jgi:hypothetical protein
VDKNRAIDCMSFCHVRGDRRSRIALEKDVFHLGSVIHLRNKFVEKNSLFLLLEKAKTYKWIGGSYKGIFCSTKMAEIYLKMEHTRKKSGIPPVDVDFGK